MPEKKNSQTGNFLSWLFKKHFLKLEIIFTPTIDKEPEKSALKENGFFFGARRYVKYGF